MFKLRATCSFAATFCPFCLLRRVKSRFDDEHASQINQFLVVLPPLSPVIPQLNQVRIACSVWAELKVTSMPIATELAIDTSADALTLATTIFGNGVTVTGATLTGAVGASATYTGADATLGGIAPGDEGIILSTGLAADFTNSSGTTDTNTTESGASTDNATAGDALLDVVSGQATQDVVVLETTFTTTGDYITLLFTFSSEEYLEYVNGGVNDAFGVWVNGVYAPFTPASNGAVSIDTVNNVSASNFYVDNPIASDTYNTEMDGLTHTLSIRAPVDSTGTNTLRIALGDGGDGIYDSNIMIAANSVQSIALAFEDVVNLEPNTASTVDVLTNDIDTTGDGLTITEINGTPVVAGQTVTLPTGEQITFNADNTLTILSDSDLGSEPFSYTVVDSAGNTDVGYVTIVTEADIPLNYVVEGTSGNDTIDVGYTLDPEGDRIDASDALDGSNNDSIEAGAGNDVINSELGDDTIDAGTGSDSVLAGLGNDSVIAGDDNDTVFGQGGDDTLLGGAGADNLDGDDGSDSIDGGSGNDTLIGDAGNDTLLGGTGNDEIYVSTGNNLIDGGADNDLVFGGDLADTIFGGTGNDTLSGGQSDDSIDGGDGADVLNGDDGNDTVIGGAGNDSVFGGVGDDSLSGGIGNDSMESWIGNDTLDGGAGDDYLDGADGNDSLLGGDGNDTLLGGNNGGEDTLIGGAGNDSLSAGDGDDTLLGGTGGDTLQGAGGDDLYGLEDNFGNDLIEGGETGETTGDTLDLSGVTDALTVDLTSLNPEAGTVSDGTDTATFSEIENIVLGAGIDTVVLADGSGDDVVGGFGAPTPIFGGWVGNDLLDVSGMTDANGAPVNTDDVTVSDTIGDGTGDTILTFPGGESITLLGVPSGLFTDPAALEAIGIPIPNYIVEGDATANLINASYTGDPEGDMVDASDNATGTDDDLILAGAGNDSVFSGAGADTVYGEDGNDILQTGAGDDLIFGGIGSDTIYAENGNDTIFAGDGDDVVGASIGSDSIDGGAGNDTINGGGFSGSGGDTIDGGIGNDVISGDGGFDSLIGGAGNDDLSGGADNDTLAGGTGFDTLGGGTGNDSLDGGTGNDFLDGEIGDDTLAGGIGDDTIDGAEGDDVIVLEDGFGNDSLDGGQTTETTGDTLDLSATTAGVTVDLTNANPEDGTVSDGTDTATFIDIENIILGAGSDTVALADGSGADTVGGFAAPTVDGGGAWTGTDQLDVSGMADANGAPVNTDDVTVTDTNGDGTGDAILTFPNGESITLTGVPSTTFIDPEALEAIGIPIPNYIVEGGSGNDSIDAGFIGDPEGDLVDANDNATGTNDDSIVAGAGDDTVIAGAGSDTVSGGDGVDIIYGNDGNDSLFGDADNDLLYAGDGADTLDGGTGADVLQGNAGADVLIGGEGADNLGGGADNDTLDGGADNDNLTGGTGDDSITGGTGNDSIWGDDGNDTITGGAGNDAMYAGTGDDLVDGGVGVDYVQLTSGNDTVLAGDDQDNIDLFAGAYVDGAVVNVDGGDGGVDNDTLDLESWFFYTNLVQAQDPDTNSTSGTVEVQDAAGNWITVNFTEIENLLLPPPLPNYIVEGTSGGDVIDVAYTGDPEGDRIENNDALDGSNDDSVEAGAGNDSITSGTGNDSVIAGTGNDTVNAGTGDDVVDGGAGSDVLDGGADNDTVVGADGDDTLTGDDGDDLLVGDISGSDAVYYNTSTGELLQYNPETGTTDVVTTGLQPYGDIAMTPDGSLYGVLFITSATTDQGIYQIDPVTGIQTQVFDLPDTGGNIASLTSSPSGDLYLTNDTTGAVTIIPSDGAGGFSPAISGGTVPVGVKDLVFLDDGSVWATAGGEIISYDVDPTGALTNPVNLGTVSGQIDIWGLHLGDDGLVYATEGSGEVYSTDPTGPIVWTQEPDADTNGGSIYGATSLSTDLTAVGNDSIDGGAGDDTIYGGAGDDTIAGDEGSDSIAGGSGDDAIEAAQGDTISGGDGDDTFTLVDLAEAGTGTIFIEGGEGGETNGDTLDLNGIADRTTLNITNPIDVGGGISGTVQLLDGTIVDFANIENIICFTPGTMVATHAGLRKIEDLQVGDPVMTQDNGIQKIGWIGKTTVGAHDSFAPVKFAKSVFPGATDDLIVSPQHRMLIKGYRAELLFGQSEVLVPAIDMIDGKDVTRLHQESVTYIHVMFEQHEIIFANGIPAESYHPGAFGVGKLEDQAREELFTLFPELRSDLNHYGPTARMALKSREAKVLAGF